MRAGITLAVGVLAAVVALIVGEIAAVQRLELKAVDARFTIRGNQGAPKDVVILGIDESTLDRLNRQTPYPRSVHAGVIDTLRRDGAAAIGYDIEFSDPSLPHEDAALLAAARRAGPRLVLGTTKVRGTQPIVIAAADLRRRGVRIGDANFPLDKDGAIRRMTATFDGVPQFSIVTAQTAARRPIDAKPLEGDGAWIDFPGKPGTVREIPFADAVQGRLKPEDVRGKVVIVGATAPSLQDQHTTSEPGLMSGPEINAAAIHTALSGFPLSDAPGWVKPLLAFIAALIAPLATLRGRAGRAIVRAVVVAGIGLVVLLAGVQLAFDEGVVVPIVVPIIALVLGTLGASAVAYAPTEIRERRRMRATFERFVPKPVVEDLLQRRDASPRIPGQRVEATVLFCDLRGFTTLAERLEGEQVIAVLDRWFNEMGDAVLDHGGTLVSFQGDGMMAVFGAPIHTEAHAEQAVSAAREMLDMRLPRFTEWLVAEGVTDAPMRVGIGINTGVVMSGSVGSDRRLEYAAVGDATNTAARLQALSKESEHQLFVAESTRDAIGGGDGLVWLGPMEIRGRAERIVVWTLASPEAEA